MATRESRKITIREHEKETIWMLNRATELRELIGKRIKLAKPIRSGFKRFFIVDRKKCTKKEYELLNSILPFINIMEYSQTEDFADVRHLYWNLSNRFADARGQLNGISDTRYKTLDEQQRTCFHKEFEWYNHRLTGYYAKKLKLVVEKHYITTTSFTDTKAEEEYAIIQHRLWEEGWAFKYGPKSYRDNDYDYRTSKQRTIDKIKIKEAKEAMYVEEFNKNSQMDNDD